MSIQVYWHNQYSGVSLRDRFNEKYTVNDSGCWVWIAGRSSEGYGVFSLHKNGKRNFLAHRISYNIYKGPIPEGNDIHHTCKNKSCVNPEHLVLVTDATHPDNAPAIHRAKTHCPNGHPYSGENLSLRKDNKWGGRRCRECDRQKALRYLSKNRQKINAKKREARRSGLWK